MTRTMKYSRLKKIIVVPLVFLTLTIHAQRSDEDSAYRITDVDSVAPSPPAEESFDEAYKDTTPAFSRSVYFLDKRLQRSGGGPDSLQYRKLPDTALNHLKADDQFWYVNYDFEKKKEEVKQEDDNVPFIERDVFQKILWILIIGAFFAVIVIYLSNSNVSLFRRSQKVIKEEGDSYVETDNIFEIDYQRDIDRAINSGNFRLAIRLMFLRLLKNLSDKNIIQYKQDRTNFDYLLQLNATRYYQDFFRLTRFYEYSWYGQIEVDREKFPAIKNDFENFDHNLK